MASYIELHRRQGRQALSELFSRPLGNLLTVFVLAFSLALPTILFILTKNVIAVTSQWQTPNQLTVYLKDVPTHKIETLAKELSTSDDIASVNYISPDEGLKELQKIQGFKDAVNLLENNPLPAVLVIVPAKEDAALATQIAAQLRKQQAVVDEVRFDNDWLLRLGAIEKLVKLLMISFSTLMLVAVVLIIGNTLRLQLLSQKEEIQVMKLVGATDSYILRPYLYTGMWLALFGALLAWGLSILVILLLSVAVEHLANLYNSGFNLVGLRFDEVIILLMLSGILGHTAAKIAVKRHLKEIEPV